MDKRLLDRFMNADMPLISMPHHTEDFDPLRQPGHRFVLAGDGLYKEIRRAWLYAVVRIAEVKTPYGPLQELARMPFKLAQTHLRDFELQARRYAPLETAAWVVWDEQTNELRLQELANNTATSVFLEVQRPCLKPHEHLVLDMHSHHVMSAKFSSTDDADDIASNEVKVAGVVGRINEINPHWNFRLCLEGVLMTEFSRKLQIGALP